MAGNGETRGRDWRKRRKRNLASKQVILGRTSADVALGQQPGGGEGSVLSAARHNSSELRWPLCCTVEHVHSNGLAYRGRYFVRTKGAGGFAVSGAASVSESKQSNGRMRLQDLRHMRSPLQCCAGPATGRPTSS